MIYDMDAINLQATPHLWLSGPAGSGKTSAAVDCLIGLLRSGTPAESILVLVPQRSLAEPYRRALLFPDLPGGSEVDVLTLNSLAQRCIQLFWPLIALPAGFASADVQPTFLTIETAQVHLAGVVREKIEQEGYFAAVQIDPNRLYSQLLDNLNKSALVGFPHSEIGSRLKAAWDGPVSQLRVYDQAQDCIEAFRSLCYAHNLLDFSLQIEIFIQQLWPQQLCRQYLTGRYRHLIYDNVEEDTPVAHDLVQEWLPALESAILITDDGGGFRRFLGADPASARALGSSLAHARVCHPAEAIPLAFRRFNQTMASVLGQPVPTSERETAADLHERICVETSRYFPAMLDWCAATITRLIQEEGIPPQEIAVVAPFLPDTLRFSLTRRLTETGISWRSVRPSRSLREEPEVQCLLTLARLAHPFWQSAPPRQDVVLMLMQVIPELDYLRASLLGDIAYQRKGDGWYFSGFDQISEREKSRITYLAGEKYETLRTWLTDYQSLPADEPDIFFQRIFGELLTAPGFGFLSHPSAGEATANLIESARKFRQQMQSSALPKGESTAQAFVEAVEQGLVAAQFLRSYEPAPQPAVLLAPAHTYLMQNQAVDVQIWLDIGSNGWWERLEQPLTHPYVLSRSWPPEKKWNMRDEFATNQETMFLLTQGLLQRCRKKAYLVYLEVNEQGFEQQGALLKAVQTSLTRLEKEANHAA